MEKRLSFASSRNGIAVGYALSVVFVSCLLVIAAQSVFADCPVPQFVNMPSLQVHKTGEPVQIHVQYGEHATVDFKFEYRSINTNLWGQPNPYQPDNFTKMTSVIGSWVSGGPSSMAGTITENQSGSWKAYVRSMCALKPLPGTKTSPPSAVSAWSAPVEFIFIDQNSDGIFASVKVAQPAFSGKCPTTVCADARIQSYYGTPVSYSWVLPDGKTLPGGTLSFSSALEIKDVATKCFQVGGISGPGNTDPPLAGQISLVVNGKNTPPLPGASYKVHCTPQFMETPKKEQLPLKGRP